jgi:hypothetical protein
MSILSLQESECTNKFYWNSLNLKFNEKNSLQSLQSYMQIDR